MIQIENKIIDNNSPVFIVGEISANHNHDINRAYKLIDILAECGADAVKIQTYTPDTITLKSTKKYFMTDSNGLWKNRYLYDLYEEGQTPYQWHDKLQKYAKKQGLIFFSTPFDTTSVDFLETLNVPCYKISSFEINDIYLLNYIAEKNKPTFISLGVAEYKDIVEVVNIFKSKNNNNIVLLKCTSSYPAKIEDSNLVMIKDISDRFKVFTGLSDHTLGYSVAIGAACMGAKVIEKHITFDKNDGGVDSAFSMSPYEFKEMVKIIREIEKAQGVVDYNLSDKITNKLMDRRSLFSSKYIKKGEIITKDNIKSVRPAYGLNTKYYNLILGKKAKIDIDFAEPLSLDMFED